MATLALNSAVNFLLPFIRQNQCKLSAIELAQIAETQLGLSNITIFLFTTAVQISGAIIVCLGHTFRLYFYSFDKWNTIRRRREPPDMSLRTIPLQIWRSGHCLLLSAPVAGTCQKAGRRPPVPACGGSPFAAPLFPTGSRR